MKSASDVHFSALSVPHDSFILCNLQGVPPKGICLQMLRLSASVDEKLAMWLLLGEGISGQDLIYLFTNK